MKKRIGIIDDDDELSEMLSEILEQEGYTVKRFSDTVFVDILVEENFDIVLLDVWFDSNRAGIEMAQAIVNNEHFTGVPILMMSSDPNLEEYAKKAGIENYLKKPIDFDTMVGVVNKLAQEN